MKNKILFLFALLALSFDARAQSTGSWPATPDVAAVMKHIDFPATNHTGIVSTRIPLYNIQLSDFQLNLSLDYQARGIQVEEIASSVGLGWSLHAGGMITRAVRGEPDDFNKTGQLDYFAADPRFPRIGRFWTGSAEEITALNEKSKDHAYIESALTKIALPRNYKGYSYHGKNDTQPDLFYFKCNDISGQFVFDVKDDGTQTIKLIPCQDVTITHGLNSEGEISSFTLKDFKGNTYFFNTPERILRVEERTFPFYNAENDDYDVSIDHTESYYHTAWYLTRITTRYGQTIQFEYADEKYTMFDQTHHHIRPFGVNIPQTSFGTLNTSTKKRISKITTPDEIITFRAASQKRQDMPMTDNYAIGQIEVKVRSTSEVLKHWVFSYDYFVGEKTSPTVYYTENSEKRLRLSQLEEKGVGMHRFTYSPRTLPDRYSYRQDFWGFHNSAPNTSLLPSIWFYPGKKGTERFSLYRLDPQKQEPEWEYKGADRKARPFYTSSGMLTGIIHPEGGKTEFVYESNRFTYQDLAVEGGGVRIKTIKKYDSEFASTPALERHYTYSTGKIISMPVFAYIKGTSVSKRQLKLFSQSQNQPGMTNGGFVGYEKVTVREASDNKVFGETVYTFHLPATYKDVSDAATGGIYKASITYLVGAPLSGDVSHITGMNVFPFPPHPEYDWNRGQLLSKKIYDAAGVLKQETQYTYKLWYPSINSQKPDVVYGLRFNSNPHFVDYPSHNSFLCKYEHLTQVASVLTSVTEKSYEIAGKEPFTTYIRYGYNTGQLTPSQIKRSGTAPGEFLVTNYKFANNFAPYSHLPVEGAYRLCQKGVNAVIEESNFIQRDGFYYLTSSTINWYRGGLSPYSTETIQPNELFDTFKNARQEGNEILKDHRYKAEKIYLRHDYLGNCMEEEDKNGLVTVTLWSYTGKYPVAIIKNATYMHVREVLGASFTDGLSRKATLTASELSLLRSLKDKLPKAEVTVCAYRDKVGISQITNPQGVTTYYDYTTYGRLKEIYTLKNGAKEQQKSYTYREYTAK